MVGRMESSPTPVPSYKKGFKAQPDVHPVCNRRVVGSSPTRAFTGDYMVTAVTTTTLREDLGLLDRAGHPVTAALTRFIAKAVSLVDEKNSTSPQSDKDLVINDLCSNMVQNWFINNDEKRKGKVDPYPTRITEAMNTTLTKDFVTTSLPRDDSRM